MAVGPALTTFRFGCERDPEFVVLTGLDDCPFELEFGVIDKVRLNSELYFIVDPSEPLEVNVPFVAKLMYHLLVSNGVPPVTKDGPR